MHREQADIEAGAVIDMAERQLADGDRFVRCDLGSATCTDLATVDRLARLRLDARRRHCRLEIRTQDDELRHLLRLAGLADVVLENR